MQYFFLSDFHTLSFALDYDDCLFILLQVKGGEESVIISLQSVICNVSKLNKEKIQEKVANTVQILQSAVYLNTGTKPQ